MSIRKKRSQKQTEKNPLPFLGESYGDWKIREVEEDEMGSVLPLVIDYFVQRDPVMKYVQEDKEKRFEIVKSFFAPRWCKHIFRHGHFLGVYEENQLIAITSLFSPEETERTLGIFDLAKGFFKGINIGCLNRYYNSTKMQAFANSVLLLSTPHWRIMPPNPFFFEEKKAKGILSIIKNITEKKPIYIESFYSDEVEFLKSNQFLLWGESRICSTQTMLPETNLDQIDLSLKDAEDGVRFWMLCSDERFTKTTNYCKIPPIEPEELDIKSISSISKNEKSAYDYLPKPEEVSQSAYKSPYQGIPVEEE